MEIDDFKNTVLPDREPYKETSTFSENQMVGFRSSINIWKRDKRGILEKIRKMQEEFGE